MFSPSCPSWARGLKCSTQTPTTLRNVVPLVGTWIEIVIKYRISVSAAPSCPSWARGLKSREAAGQLLSVVVPLVGTWIEIMTTPLSPERACGSCPSWARGLKSFGILCVFVAVSCPSWARGLKLGYGDFWTKIQVVPLVGTWIEITTCRRRQIYRCRAPRGHVD